MSDRLARTGCGLVGFAAFFVSLLLVFTPLLPAPIVVAIVLAFGLRKAWRDSAPGGPARARVLAFLVGVLLGAVTFGGCMALVSTGRIRMAG